MKRRRLIIPALIVTILVAGGIYWFTQNSESVFEEPDEVPAQLLAQAERRDIESRLLLSGEVRPAFQVPVKAEVGGKLRRIAVEAGDTVKRGDVLAEIDDTELLTELDSANTEIAGAELSVEKNRGNYERAKSLYEEKLISKEVFANLEADMKISENTLQKALSRRRTVEDKLNKTRILAPADGTILAIPVNEGEVVVAAASVNSGTVIMTFADLSRLLIDTHVNQIDISKLKVGQEVEVMMQGDQTEPVIAEIDFIAPLAEVKNNIKGFQVEAVIKDDGDLLKPGMSVSMTVPVGSAPDAVSVPIAAVFQQDDERVVYVRNGKTTERRKVTVGLSNMQYAEILSGLNEGEQILLFEPKLDETQS